MAPAWTEVLAGLVNWLFCGLFSIIAGVDPRVGLFALF